MASHRIYVENTPGRNTLDSFDRFPNRLAGDLHVRVAPPAAIHYSDGSPAAGSCNPVAATLVIGSRTSIPPPSAPQCFPRWSPTSSTTPQSQTFGQSGWADEPHAPVRFGAVPAVLLLERGFHAYHGTAMALILAGVTVAGWWNPQGSRAATVEVASIQNSPPNHLKLPNSPAALHHPSGLDIPDRRNSDRVASVLQGTAGTRDSSAENRGTERESTTPPVSSG
jgi:hypothetical protein